MLVAISILCGRFDLLRWTALLAGGALIPAALSRADRASSPMAPGSAMYQNRNTSGFVNGHDR